MAEFIAAHQALQAMHHYLTAGMKISSTLQSFPLLFNSSQTFPRT